MQRFFVLPREFHRFRRSAGQRPTNGEQNGRVTITHIPFGPLNVGYRRRFFQRILRVNQPIFRFPAFRTPSATLYSVGQCPIQCRPVRTGLATGNNCDWGGGVLEFCVLFIADGLPGCLGTISLLLYCIRIFNRDARNARSNPARAT